MSKSEIENKILEIQKMINEDLKNKKKTNIQVKRILFVMKDKLKSLDKTTWRKVS